MTNIASRLTTPQPGSMRETRLQQRAAVDPVMATPLAVAAGVTAVAAAFTAGIAIGAAG